MHNHAGRALRTDIQGMRAVAVAMVVVYHLHAPLLPGGFVGVDVFFVISGFLITAHLLGRPPARFSDLADFWGRRIRRLLPASLTVLACALVLMRLFGPETQWEPNAQDARAAALYVVNWSLAERAVDYLAQDNVPTAVQHFWSLSVEEQFYFFWPILIGLLVLAARALKVRRELALALGLGAVVAASLAFSIAETHSDPSRAYFVTTTRIWELGTGGLLALLVSHLDRPEARQRLSTRARAISSWTGLALLVVTGFAYSHSTPFPGYQAALPVLGAALVLLGAPRDDERLTPGPALAARPVQWLGDISYSVYLWHWPLIVVAPYVLGHEPGAFALLAVLVLTLVLAALTERFIEQPFRAPSIARYRKGTYAVALGAMAVLVGMATVQLREVANLDDTARDELAAALKGDDPCFGAPALERPGKCDDVDYDELLPSPALAPKDRSAAYQDVGGRQCWSFTPSFPTRECTFGKRRSATNVVLIGNSHAGQWLPALQVVAREKDLRVTTYLASQCASADLLQTFKTVAFSEACREWARRTTAAVAQAQPDLVIMSNRVSMAALDEDLAGSLPLYEEGYRAVLTTLRAAGIPVLVIRDTPAPGFAVPTCIADAEQEYATCDGTRDDWLPADPTIDAVASLDDPGITVADLTDHICAGDECRVVNGGVITYFDASHLTATYAHTLAPYLEPFVMEALGTRQAIPDCTKDCG